MASEEEDPFLQVQADVLSQIANTRPLFTSYLRIRSISRKPDSPEVLSARHELEDALTSLAEDLADLVSSVEAIQADSTNFGLSAHEVLRRKRLVDDVGNEVEDMRKSLLASTANLNKPLPPDIDDEIGTAEEDAYGRFEHQEQVRIMHEQDQALDGVFGTVRNIRQQADDMGRELEEQAEMIEHVDTLTDRVGGKLQHGRNRLGRMMREGEDKYSGCCIGVLIFVLIILLVLLLIL